MKTTTRTTRTTSRSSRTSNASHNLIFRALQLAGAGIKTFAGRSTAGYAMVGFKNRDFPMLLGRAASPSWLATWPGARPPKVNSPADALKLLPLSSRKVQEVLQQVEAQPVRRRHVAATRQRRPGRPRRQQQANTSSNGGGNVAAAT